MLRHPSIVARKVHPQLPQPFRIPVVAGRSLREGRQILDCPKASRKTFLLQRWICFGYGNLFASQPPHVEAPLWRFCAAFWIVGITEREREEGGPYITLSQLAVADQASYSLRPDIGSLSIFRHCTEYFALQEREAAFLGKWVIFCRPSDPGLRIPVSRAWMFDWSMALASPRPTPLPSYPRLNKREVPEASKSVCFLHVLITSKKITRTGSPLLLIVFTFEHTFLPLLSPHNSLL